MEIYSIGFTKKSAAQFFGLKLERTLLSDHGFDAFGRLLQSPTVPLPHDQRRGPVAQSSSSAASNRSSEIFDSLAAQRADADSALGR